MGKTDIKSLPLEQLEQWAVEHGEKKIPGKTALSVDACETGG